MSNCKNHIYYVMGNSVKYTIQTIKNFNHINLIINDIFQLDYFNNLLVNTNIKYYVITHSYKEDIHKIAFKIPHLNEITFMISYIGDDYYILDFDSTYADLSCKYKCDQIEGLKSCLVDIKSSILNYDSNILEIVELLNKKYKSGKIFKIEDILFRKIELSSVHSLCTFVKMTKYEKSN